MDDPRHDGAAASLRRLRLIARHTLGEAVHLRLTLLLGLAGAGLVGAALGLRDFNFGGAELKFLGDFGLGVLGFFGMLLAALTMAQLFFRDLEGRAACFALARPVRRWEYVAGKFSGVAGVLAIFTATLGLLLAGLLAGRAAQLGLPSPDLRLLLGACGVLWLKSTLVAAMTLLVCSYAGSALFASGVGLMLTLVAHLRPLAHDGGMGWLRVWPNLALFDGESLLNAGQPVSAAWLLGLTGYGAAYVLLFGTVAALAFRHREL